MQTAVARSRLARRTAVGECRLRLTGGRLSPEDGLPPESTWSP